MRSGFVSHWIITIFNYQVAKCEFFNAGGRFRVQLLIWLIGSIKDRIAKRMIEQLEEEGKIVPGVTTIIEVISLWFLIEH